jgi:methionyl-tRNA synthetase
MAEKNSIYITTTLPYVNADPHVGFAMEIIRADVLARWHRLLGKEVFLNTGTDEHGAKIHEAAQKEGIDPQAYTDRFAERFKELAPLLNLSVDNFIRTTDAHHVSAAQEFWKRCDAKGDIYKKLYTVKYCIGCELEKTESELVDGRCPIHPNRELELREEENYFFRFSKYTEALKAHFMTHPDFVIPESRRNEMLAFLERGLEDFSISRLKSKMSWGVPVPGDDTQVMYVWFDALVNYISAIGWPLDMERFEKWWPVIQYCGKDNTRQQSLMWQGMLLSADIPSSKHIIVDGFITSGGQKMSKSLGNVINPKNVIAAFEGHALYPEDVLRFVLLHDVPSFEDGDLTMEGIKVSYAAYLQNGIGNLTNRIMKMATTHLPSPVDLPVGNDTVRHLSGHMEAFDLKRGIEYVLKLVTELDSYIQMNEPFKVVKVDHERGKTLIKESVWRLYAIASDLAVFLPHTSAKIIECIHLHKMPKKPLFNRLP